MAYVIQNPALGMPAIASTVLTAATTAPKPWKHGDIVRAVDPTYGAGEFIYLKGVANTVVGSWVTYSADDWSTKLIAPNAIGPVAVAMSANVALYSGWYQIGGKGFASAADVADCGKVYIDTVAGKCDDAVVAGDRVSNARWASADDTATGLAEVRLNRPFVTDQKDAT